METFEAQVEGLTSLSIDGSSAPTVTELTQFLTDGAKEIINALPPSLLPLCSSSVSFTSGSSSTLNTGKVLHVFRNDGDINQPCRVISASLKGRYSDPDDMNYATITDPIFYIENNTLDVLPSGGSCSYSEVQYPSVPYGNSSIGQTSLTSVTATAADPTVFTKVKHGLSTGDVVELSNFTEMIEINGMRGTVTKLNADTFEVDGVAADPAETTGGNVVKLGGFPDEAEYLVPLYASVKALQNVLGNSVTNSDINSALSSCNTELDKVITDVINPTTPAINTISYTDASNSDASSTAVALATASTITEVDISGNAPSFVKPVVSLDFTKVNTHLDTNEDVELASVKIQEIQAQLGEYSANIQNEQAEFNKENTRYQVEFQEATQKANNDLQVALANLNAEAQEKRQEATQATDIDKFNKAQDQVLDLTNQAKSMEKLISDNNSKMQKHSNEIQLYQSQVAKLVQNAQGYLSESQSRLAVDTAKYAWYEKQQAKLQADYNKGLQFLTGGRS
tara:strand:- start:1882 stop:3411 length:1530 start_codon:yes stop_codon:yes gene_type:complete